MQSHPSSLVPVNARGQATSAADEETQYVDVLSSILVKSQVARGLKILAKHKSGKIAERAQPCQTIGGIRWRTLRRRTPLRSPLETSSPRLGLQLLEPCQTIGGIRWRTLRRRTPLRPPLETSSPRGAPAPSRAGAVAVLRRDHCGWPVRVDAVMSVQVTLGFRSEPLSRFSPGDCGPCTGKAPVCCKCCCSRPITDEAKPKSLAASKREARGGSRGSSQLKVEQQKGPVGEATEDESFMVAAIDEAKKAYQAGEVPVGAVLVHRGTIIARAHNRVEVDCDPTAHAEMLCIRQAAKIVGGWRLVDAALYVTLEPCPMCAGAMLQARVGTIVWGARNKLLGADGSWISLFPGGSMETDAEGHGPAKGKTRPIHPFHPDLVVRRGVLAAPSSELMKKFFKMRRTSNQNPPPNFTGSRSRLQVSLTIVCLFFRQLVTNIRKTFDG